VSEVSATDRIDSRQERNNNSSFIFGKAKIERTTFDRRINSTLRKDFKYFS
jgi:hypothetical protein